MVFFAGCTATRPNDCFAVRREVMARVAAAILKQKGPLDEGQELLVPSFGQETMRLRVNRITTDSVTFMGPLVPFVLTAFKAEGFDPNTGWRCSAKFEGTGPVVEYVSQVSSSGDQFVSGRIMTIPSPTGF
jgi:hypothetical protein